MDPIVQFPTNSQSLNPYTYILNSPFAGTDPTGYAIRPAERLKRDHRSIAFRSPGSFILVSGSLPGFYPKSGNGASPGSSPDGEGGRKEQDAPPSPSSRAEIKLAQNNGTMSPEDACQQLGVCRGKTKDDLDALTDGIDKAADFADTVAVTGVETLLDPTTYNLGAKAMKMVGKGVGKILGHTDEMRGATRGDHAAKAPVQAFEVGTADALKARSVVGDGLDIHHVAQAHPLEQVIPGYNRATGPAITVPRAQHSTIPTVRGPFTGIARDQLANDIWDLRNYTDAPNSSLQDLINLNKQMYPGPYTK